MEAKRGRSTPIKRNKKKRKRTKKRDQRTSFVGGPTRDENRASRLAPWKAKLLGPKPGERSWSARLSVSHRLPLFLLRFFVSSSHSRRATIAFLFCLCSARCALSLSLSHSLFLGLSLLSLFRRAKMVHGRSRAPISPRILRAEDRPLLLYIPAPLPVLPLYSPRFFAPARSVVAASRFFFAVFPFFMHAIASFALLTRRNGISVFYRLDYYHLLAAFFLLSANTPSPPPSCPALPWSLPRSEFRYFIMDGGTVERPNNMGAVYHESRKSYFEAQ